MLGHSVKDRVTGFSGVVLGVVDYLTGCSQALVQPKTGGDGSFRESHWFDVQRLEIDEGSVAVQLDNGANPGCDKQAPRI